MNTNMVVGILLLLGPTGLFIYFDKKLLISKKIQAKFKIKTFLGLYAFIIITLILSAILVAAIAMIFRLSSSSAYVLQIMLIGALLGLFSNIQKITRSKSRK
ncbi:hypothetical protein [Clostridium sp.]|uniref:hypothetical protein n=1 Tax=Clostridium sp. TaxID=1506 RepID=UPI003D6CB508